MLYGTDMGNGPTPVGPSADEIGALAEAGLDVDELIGSMAAAHGADGSDADRALVCERPLPRTAAELTGWLTACRRFYVLDL